MMSFTLVILKQILVIKWFPGDDLMDEEPVTQAGIESVSPAITQKLSIAAPLCSWCQAADTPGFPEKPV